MIIATLIVMMAANYMSVMVIIFVLTVLEPKTPIPVDMVYMEDMLGVSVVMLEEMVTVEEAVFVTG